MKETGFLFWIQTDKRIIMCFKIHLEFTWSRLQMDNVDCVDSTPSHDHAHIAEEVNSTWIWVNSTLWTPLWVNNLNISSELTQSPIVLKYCAVNFPRSHRVNPFHPQIEWNSPTHTTRKENSYIQQLIWWIQVVYWIMFMDILHTAIPLCNN